MLARLKQLALDEARRIAANIATLPGLLYKGLPANLISGLQTGLR